jgi:putative transcriptional regulator
MQDISFETRMKECRARLNLTQEALAERVGVSRETITYLEKGKYNPSLKLAYAVAKSLNTSIAELFIFKHEEI